MIPADAPESPAAHSYMLAAAAYADTCRRLADASVALALAHTTATERGPVIVAASEYLEAHCAATNARIDMDSAHLAWLRTAVAAALK